MKAGTLESLVAHFESVLTVELPTGVAHRPIAHTIREVFAVKTANRLRHGVSSILPQSHVTLGRSAESNSSGDGGPFKLARNLLSRDGQIAKSLLPGVDAVRAGAAKLMQAIDSLDAPAATRALVEMGVPGLCEPIDDRLGRLEFLVGSVVGRSRLLPLVELAILASEFEAHDRAIVYANEALSLSPGPGELHNLYSVAGLVALNSGNTADARKFLFRSADVCTRSDWARLSCGIQPPNLALAEKLLNMGEASAVVEYLTRCRTVFTHAGAQITAWISAIRQGAAPDFADVGVLTVMDAPQSKMRMLVFLSEHKAEASSPEELDITVAEMLADFERMTRLSIRGKLEGSES